MIIWVEIVLLLFLLGLLTCFGVAVVAEFRSSRKGAGLLLRLIEMAIGVIATFALLFGFWETLVFLARG